MDQYFRNVFFDNIFFQKFCEYENFGKIKYVSIRNVNPVTKSELPKKKSGKKSRKREKKKNGTPLILTAMEILTEEKSPLRKIRRKAKMKPIVLIVLNMKIDLKIFDVKFAIIVSKYARL